MLILTKRTPTYCIAFLRLLNWMHFSDNGDVVSIVHILKRKYELEEVVDCLNTFRFVFLVKFPVENGSNSHFSPLTEVTGSRSS